MTMSDDHPTGYVDLTKPNADAASSTPEPSAPEPPASTQAAPAPTE
ncbi:cell division protein, partial [Bifidobacterium longum]